MDGYTQISDTSWQNDETGMVYVGRVGQSLESLLEECTAMPPPAEAIEQTSLPPLEPWQFRAMLDIGGIAQAVDDAIAAIAETTERAVAKARFEYSLSFRRDDPLIAMLAPAVSLTDEQIDALWSQAVQLKTRTA